MRKLPDNYIEDLYIKGYLHDRLMSGDIPNYTIVNKGLPETTGRSLEIESSYMIALNNERH